MLFMMMFTCWLVEWISSIYLSRISRYSLVLFSRPLKIVRHGVTDGDARQFESRCSAEAGGFSTAARFGLTPAAVSRNVAMLERNLGQRLFQRSTRKLA